MKRLLLVAALATITTSASAHYSNQRYSRFPPCTESNQPGLPKCGAKATTEKPIVVPGVHRIMRCRMVYQNGQPVYECQAS